MEESKKMLDLAASHGCMKVDTAFMYAEGKTEVYLGNLKDQISKDFTYDTKASPWNGKGLGAKSVKNQLNTSLKNLQRGQADVFYLHAPDHKTPLTETLKAANDLYEEGKFKKLGLSNYSSWLVAEIVNLCKQNGWIKPTVYQGMYSAITRMVEKELLPCLRYYDMRFYGYSPLGGGVLTGKHKIEDVTKNEPGRFFGTAPYATTFRGRYWKQGYFDAVEKIKGSLLKEYGENTVSIAEAAYRWLYHHSALKGEFGDAVITGTATAKQLAEILAYTKKGPLEKDVVGVINSVWETTSHLCPDYAR